MKRRPMRQLFAIVAVLGCALALAPLTVDAQTTAGTIRGTVKNAEGQAVEGAAVTAVQTGTNIQRTALTSEAGFFVLPGLTPGDYVVTTSMVGYAEQQRPVRVQIGQTLTMDLVLSTQAVALAGIEVEAERLVEMTTPEVATNITTEQIENLPLNDRNFLSLALLAPGVRTDGGSITSGPQSANNINVFVDGVSFKNDILKGGVAGQDASKGNPFPQVAVQEFRIITQQYKAEYQKASSAIVTATTRSGTNEWHADLFGFRQDNSLIQRDMFTIQNCREDIAAGEECGDEPKQDRWQMGGSLGGPIIRDKLFFFAAYEGNYQDRAAVVRAETVERWPADIEAELVTHEGAFGSPFRSNLFFGKLTYALNDRHRLEASGTVRDEHDIRGFGGQDAFENSENFQNDVSTYLLKHQYNRGSLLNEAQVSYQEYHWFPEQLNVDLIGRRYEGSLKIGGRCCPQDQAQQRIQLRNDVSYTLPSSFGEHVFKIGGNLDFVDYDIIKQLQVNPQFFFVATAPDPHIPVRAEVGFGTPFIGAENTQLGIYAQDDWSVTPRLVLNLGVRWDYETNGLNNDYVTPPEVIAEVGSRTDLLLVSDNYFTDGGDRPGFKGAIQPRLGFSYDVTGNNTTVLFGGAGIFYDRVPYTTTIGERERLVWQVFQIRFSPDGSEPGTIAWDDSYFTREGLETVVGAGTTGLPEVFLLENDTKPPHTNHFSLGVRQAWRDLLFSVNYSGVRGYDNFTWMFANRGPDGRTFGLPSYRNVLVGTDEGRTWYDAVFFKAEKRFTEDSRWGGGLAYTLGWADATIDAGQDFAGLSFATPDDFVRRRSEFDERHRVAANWIVGLPLDIRFSGIVNLGSGSKYRVFYGGDACATGNMDCIGNEYPDGGGPGEADPTPWGGTNPFTGERETKSFLGIPGFAFRNVDLRFEKEFSLQQHNVGIIVEGFNIFDFDNIQNYEGRIGNLLPDGTVAPNLEFGQPRSVITDTRLMGAPPRWQFGLRYSM